ncbi:MAG: extracellular solute-binding protein [Chloroflexota bacterium]|nr:extracellular solute-binding protein [Chloroflexota bacterium]
MGRMAVAGFRGQKGTRRAVLAAGVGAGAVTGTGSALSVACSGTGGLQSDAPTGAVAKAPLTLRVQTRTGVDLDKYWLQRKSDFEATLPHVTLEVEAVAGGPLEYVTKLLVLQSGGGIGDAAWGTTRAGYIKFLSSKSVFVPIEALVKADKLALNEYYAKALEENTYNGKLMALPHITEPGRGGLIWNKSLFAGTSAKEPDLTWTYDTLREASIAASRGPSEARDVFGLNGSYGYLEFMPILRAFGGDLLSIDGTKCVLDSPAGMAAVQWQHDMIRRHSAVPPPGVNPAPNFNTGQVALQPSNPMTAQTTAVAIKGAFQLGTSLLPKGPSGKRGSILVSHTMGVTSATKHVPEAWAWTKWACSKDFGVHRVLTGNGGPGGRPDIWKNEQLHKEVAGWQNWVGLMDEVMPHHIPANLRGQEVEDALNKQLNAVWRGEVAPADGVKQAVSAVNEVLRQPA